MHFGKFPQMEKRRLKLPTGIHTFERIREEGRVYVDKTRYLVDIIDNINVCFLARPRRFGKSLTVSTFEALFSGRKELFEGLYAEEFLNRPGFKPSPVISLDMSSVSLNEGIEGIKQSLKQIFIETADRLGIEVSKDMLASDLFRNIIVKTSLKHNQRVVVLIDEYDAPYTNFVNNSTMADKVRDILRDCYTQIKANDRYIRFVFITGVSKFAKFGVFSKLNNTTDISLKPEYAGMCGYTEEEIMRYFPDYLDDTAKMMDMSTEDLLQKMRDYYNGFCFDRSCKTRLYNPYSTLAFFDDKTFANYWVETGQAKFLADYMKNRNLTVEQFRSLSIPEDFARSPGDVDTTPPEGFLYQCGYLTLRQGTATGNFSLDYPNTEVLHSMSRLLIQNIVTEDAYNALHHELISAVTSNNVKDFVKAVNRLLARIPYDDFSKGVEQTVTFRDYPEDERVYRSCIYSFLLGCGLRVYAEMHTNKGRSDLIFSHVDNPTVWVVELKIARKGDAPAKKVKEALLQIEEKNYAAPFSNALCVGLAIDEEKRLITDVNYVNTSV